MALKKKITKAEFDKLAKHFQDEYKADGDAYKLDVSAEDDDEEDAGALKRALQRERDEKKQFKKDLKEAKEALEAIEEEKNKGAGNVEALEKSWGKKLADKETELKGKIDKLTSSLTRNTVGAEAFKLANDLSTKAPKLLLPFIEKRMTLDLEGDEPKLRILDKDGKASALTIDDLKKEFVDNADFSAIITASKATGGAGADKNKPGGAPQNNDKPVDLSKASPAALVAHLDAAKT